MRSPGREPLGGMDKKELSPRRGRQMVSLGCQPQGIQQDDSFSQESIHQLGRVGVGLRGGCGGRYWFAVAVACLRVELVLARAAIEKLFEPLPGGGPGIDGERRRRNQTGSELATPQKLETHRHIPRVFEEVFANRLELFFIHSIEVEHHPQSCSSARIDSIESYNLVRH